MPWCVQRYPQRTALSSVPWPQSTLPRFAPLVQEDVLFVVDPALQSQVHYLVGTMMTVPGRGESILTSGNRGDSDAISEVAGTPIHLIRPRVFTAALLRTLFEENPNLRERLGLTDGSGN